ncbi:MAG: ATP-binding cassette domain-containing protein [Actinomycetota bacterium]
MASVEVAHLGIGLPDGRRLFDDVSFRIGDGQHAAIVGTNGCGKSTLLRIIAGEQSASDGTVTIDGELAVMPQLVGMGRDDLSARALLLAAAPDAVQRAAEGLERAERVAVEDPERGGVAYANALAAWEEAGGYELEVEWDECATRAIGLPFAEIAERSVTTFSGGEQKRLLLEYLLRCDRDVLLLDEPDNFLDVPGKEWLARQISSSPKTIVLVSHDRELLAAATDRIVTIEGGTAWVHGGSYSGWAHARQARRERIDDERRRWAEERKRHVAHLREMKQRAALNDSNARRAKAAETRLRHFDQAGPPPDRVVDQNISMRLSSGGTGERVLEASALELTDLTFPFDLEVFARERVAVIGRNGTGKSHFLRLIGGGDVEHEGGLRLGARVVPGHFSQTHDHPELVGRTPVEIVAEGEGRRNAAMSKLRRYELDGAGDQPWETLSGGQQARLQILLLELAGSSLLLLDEPTDNLDIESAEALQAGLDGFDGVVIAVTHDRWFLRSFDRYVVFQDDGEVREVDTPELIWTA